MSEQFPEQPIERLYNEVKVIIEEARNKVYKAVNTTLIRSNWEIGKRIVEEEQQGKDRADYGKELIKQLSKRLMDSYGSGYTETNLKYMRQFYTVFEKGHALRDELSWTHYRLLLKVHNDKARTYYLQSAIEQGW